MSISGWNSILVWQTGLQKITECVDALVLSTSLSNGVQVRVLPYATYLKGRSKMAVLMITVCVAEMVDVSNLYVKQI